MAERCYPIRGEKDLATAPELDAELGAVTGDNADSLVVDFADFDLSRLGRRRGCSGDHAGARARRPRVSGSSTRIASQSTFSKSTAS